MEIKRMRGRYVRIAPEFITNETQECVDSYYWSEKSQKLIQDETYIRDDETDYEWEKFCNSIESKPYIKEQAYVNRNGACFTEPYEVFKVQHEFYGINMLPLTADAAMDYPTYMLREEDLTANCEHHLVINSTDKNTGLYPIWSADHFEVVKRVEEITTEQLPMGVTKEIKTISWVRDEEFYN